MKKQSQMLKKYYLISQVVKKITKLVSEPHVLFEENKTYHVFKHKMPYNKKVPKYYFLFNKFKNKRYSKSLKKIYDSITVQEYNTRYVFVALHYQPEETSTPTGGAYAEQELIINLLDSF